MESTDKFNEIKAEILSRAKEANACKEQYGRAYTSGSLAELMQVVKDNFSWACCNKVITPDLIEKYREEFASNDIYLNVNVEHGYLLCDNSSVEARNNSSVVAWNNSSVVACGNSYTTSYYKIECKLSDNAIYRVESENTIYYANENMKFVKQ